MSTCTVVLRRAGGLGGELVGSVTTDVGEGRGSRRRRACGPGGHRRRRGRVGRRPGRAGRLLRGRRARRAAPPCRHSRVRLGGEGGQDPVRHGRVPADDPGRLPGRGRLADPTARQSLVAGRGERRGACRGALRPGSRRRRPDPDVGARGQRTLRRDAPGLPRRGPSRVRAADRPAGGSRSRLPGGGPDLGRGRHRHPDAVDLPPRRGAPALPAGAGVLRRPRPPQRGHHCGCWTSSASRAGCGSTSRSPAAVSTPSSAARWTCRGSSADPGAALLPIGNRLAA